MSGGMSKHENPHKGETHVWLTPLEIIRALGEFDLDPCAAPGHKTARTCIHKEICDGLNPDFDWTGRVWLNPPYDRDVIGKWLDKLAAHGRGIALVFARTENKWAQRILPQADSVFFPAGRIRFLREDKSTPPFTAGAPSMFLSFGEIPDWHKIGPGWIVVNKINGDSK